MPRTALYPDVLEADEVAACYTDGAVAPVWQASLGGNASALSEIRRDVSGRETGLTWTLAGTTVVNDVVRRPSGRITADTLNGVTSTYSYDTVGRLATAQVPGHVLQYRYEGDSSGQGCATAPYAGRNTNRTSMVDNGVTTTYCYDQADRLISTSDGHMPAVAYDAWGTRRLSVRCRSPMTGPTDTPELSTVPRRLSTGGMPRTVSSALPRVVRR